MRHPAFKVSIKKIFFSSSPLFPHTWGKRGVKKKTMPFKSPTPKVQKPKTLNFGARYFG
jgi:hypothetical protein